MSTLLLTGGTGFVGSHVLKALLAKTTHDVIILKRSFSNTQRITDDLQHKRVRWIDIDITPLSEVPWSEVAAIIHCATEYGRENGFCSKVLQTNLLFPIQLLEQAVKYGVRAFINTDSYFNKNHLSYSYLLDYSLSKKSLNLWLKYFSRKISIINLRLEHVYGPGDNKDKFVQYVIENVALHPQEALDFSFGEQKRDFIYIDDACACYVEAVCLALTRRFHFKQIEVGTGQLTSIRDFVETVKRLSHSSTRLNFGALPYRVDEIMASCAKKPCVPCYKTVEEGISCILEYYKRERLCH